MDRHGMYFRLMMSVIVQKRLSQNDGADADDGAFDAMLGRGAGVGWRSDGGDAEQCGGDGNDNVSGLHFDSPFIPFLKS